MQKVIEPILTDYEFLKDTNNEIISAVYPMREHLKKENTKRTVLGGSPLITIETGLNRFSDLGIPVGLYLESNYNLYRNDDLNQKRDIPCSVIEDDLFDKLLGSVSSIKSNPSTRKNSLPNHKVTKKVTYK
jgi:hypothetical protein